jgi:hypothetical protein
MEERIREARVCQIVLFSNTILIEYLVAGYWPLITKSSFTAMHVGLE